MHGQRFFLAFCHFSTYNLVMAVTDARMGLECSNFTEIKVKCYSSVGCLHSFTIIMITILEPNMIKNLFLFSSSRIECVSNDFQQYRQKLVTLSVDNHIRPYGVRGWSFRPFFEIPPRQSSILADFTTKSVFDYYNFNTDKKYMK